MFIWKMFSKPFYILNKPIIRLQKITSTMYSFFFQTSIGNPKSLECSTILKYVNYLVIKEFFTHITAFWKLLVIYRIINIQFNWIELMNVNLITIKNCPSPKTHGKSRFYEYSFSIYQWDVKIIYFLVRFTLQKCEEANRNRTWILFFQVFKLSPVSKHNNKNTHLRKRFLNIYRYALH